MIKVGYEITYRGKTSRPKKGTVSKLKLDRKGDFAGVYVSTGGRAEYVRVEDIIGYDREPHLWRLNPKKRTVKKKVAKKKTARKTTPKIIISRGKAAYIGVLEPAKGSRLKRGFWTGETWDTVKSKARRYVLQKDAITAVRRAPSATGYRRGVLTIGR